MRERQIPFSAPMVRALLAGTKTQTRRAVRPQPANDPAKHHPIEPYATTNGRWNWVLAATGHGTGDTFPCPYGAPGDRLWVREAWRVGKGYDGVPGSAFTSPLVWYESDRGAGAIDARAGRYRHARFMPRWASRITLEVTEVRVERLQDISEADARAEGITKPVGSQFWHADPHGSSLPGETPQWAYRNLWESINGPGSWDANPWVWVVTFRRSAA